MKSRGKDKLIEKYLEAESNLNEEQEIFNAGSTNSELDPWLNFAKKTRFKAPENLNNSIWEGIQNKRKTNRRIIYGLLATAASVALIISLSVNSSKKQSYEEKEALLKEALSMFEKNEPQQEVRNIIYEDELIVIYMAQNK